MGALAGSLWLTNVTMVNYELYKNTTLQFGQLKQHFHHLNELFLKISQSDLLDYDPLVKVESDVFVTLDQLDRLTAELPHGEEKEFVDLLGQLKDSLAIKQQMVENWKASHAIARNSLNFLTIIIPESLAKQAGGKDINLLEKLLLYNLSPEILSKKELLASLDSLDIQNSDDSRLVYRHFKRFLLEEEKRENLAEAILNFGDVAILDQLIEYNENQFMAKISLSETIKTFLYALSMILILVTIYMFWDVLKKGRALTRANVTLEKRVLDRTTSITRQNSALKDLIAEKNHVNSMVAHELRTPIAQIKGLVELIEIEENLNEMQNEHLGMIKKSLENQDEVIRKILEHGQKQSSLLEIDIKRIDPTVILQETIVQFRERAQEKSLTLNQELLSFKGTIMADPVFLRQAYENLLSNAIKFSPEGKSIHLCAKAEDGYFVAVVRDEGPGIKDSEKELMFQRFQRLSAQPTGNEASTGLGLSLVKKFTEAMDGEVYCESTPGKGASFYLKFKLA